MPSVPNMPGAHPVPNLSTEASGLLKWRQEGTSINRTLRHAMPILPTITKARVADESGDRRYVYKYEGWRREPTVPNMPIVYA